jgi:hypothetical protein
MTLHRHAQERTMNSIIGGIISDYEGMPHVSIYSFNLLPTASHHPQGSSPNWEAAAVMATVDIVSRVQS